MALDPSFAAYACELLSGVGPCTARRMFGGAGISTEGLTIALVADLGGGEMLWLKANDETRAVFEAAGCQRFSYPMQRGGVSELKSMNYYSAPEEAMESPQAMLPWARIALDCALKARAAQKPRTRAATKLIAKRGVTAPPTTPAQLTKPKVNPRAKPRTKRANAAAPKPSAKRKSAKG